MAFKQIGRWKGLRISRSKEFTRLTIVHFTEKSLNIIVLMQIDDVKRNKL